MIARIKNCLLNGCTSHPVVFTVTVSVILASLYNIPFWKELIAIQTHFETREVLFLISFPVFVTCVFTTLFSIFSILRIQRHVAAFIFPIAAGGLYFMQTYHILIDRTMIENVFQTDSKEVRDLISITLFFYLFILGFFPAFVFLKMRIRPFPLFKTLFIHGGMILGCLAIVGAIAIPFYRDYASTFRNHRPLLYLINPTNSISGVWRYVSKDLLKSSQKMTAIGMDAVQTDMANRKPNLIVMVVGEAARAQSFSLFGHDHDTNPLLEKQADIIPLSNLWSCGTSTAVSVPCMFSPFTREQYSKSKFDGSENVVDVLKHAGLNLYWKDNNSSCKGVCERIKNDNVLHAKNPKFCASGDCYDTILLDGLDKQIPDNGKDTVLFIHQKGSHGPAYYRRVPPEFKKFIPECEQNELQECSPEAIHNAYDNTVLYTDYNLEKTIQWLLNKSDKYNVAMIYMSDHGQSLGEKGLYLHGMPYMFAPEEQTHPAALMWIPPEFAAANHIDKACVMAKKDDNFSHDNLFHTLLGINHVKTSVYDSKLDILNGCYTP